MNIFAIADLHLSLGSDKPMDVFSGWDGYVEKLKDHWCSKVNEADIVVIAGDVSWGMSLEESLTDFEFIHSLPGQKYILKGNHDYWWTTAKKMNSFFEQHGLTSLHILHNNCVVCGGLALCGTRGWIFENGQPQDQKIVAREAQRLETSLKAAGDREKIVFLHYPPIYMKEMSVEIMEVLHHYQVKTCYYGHIHGGGRRFALNGTYMDIQFQLISCDQVDFDPVFVASIEMKEPAENMT